MYNEYWFSVETPEGAIYRRNRKFLNKTPNQILPQPEPEPTVQQKETRQTRSHSAISNPPISPQEAFSPPEPQNVTIESQPKFEMPTQIFSRSLHVSKLDQVGK